jgi:hypothetical protein
VLLVPLEKAKEGEKESSSNGGDVDSKKKRRRKKDNNKNNKGLAYKTNDSNPKGVGVIGPTT